MTGVAGTLCSTRDELTSDRNRSLVLGEDEAELFPVVNVLSLVKMLYYFALTISAIS